MVAKGAGHNGRDRKQRREPQVWKIGPGQVLRVGSTIFEVDRKVLLKITARHRIRRLNGATDNQAE